ncbi:hypothetical protein Lal_00018634 [Lupinus albus]|nr:hypothetical protein Lal_00018634 [Lupinus albus]
MVIILDKEWKNGVMDFVTKEDTFNVISAYAPQVGQEEHEKIKFWEDLEGVRNIFLGGNLNGHVGWKTRGFKGFHGEYDKDEANMEGMAILDFSVAFDFAIAKTYFTMREEHLITYKNGCTLSN